MDPLEAIVNIADLAVRDVAFDMDFLRMYFSQTMNLEQSMLWRNFRAHNLTVTSYTQDTYEMSKDYETAMVEAGNMTLYWREY